MFRLSSIPGWAQCFLLTLMVYLLQLFPMTGVFLMLVAAAYWSVLLINLGFALLLRDALTGRAPRWVAVAPLLWFGGYLAISAVSHWQATRFVAGIDAANAGKRAVFDPAAQDLVILGNGMSDDLSALDLLNEHGLTQVFTIQEPGNGTRYESVYALAERQCPDAAGVHDENGAATVYQRAGERDADDRAGFGDMRFATGLCQSRGTGRPARPAVELEAGGVGGERRWWLDTERTRVGIRTPAGTTALQAGSASPLSWLPQPVLGCALNSASPRWECFAGFLRGFDARSNQRTSLQVVVRALGLPTIGLRQRFPNAGWS